MSASSPGGKRGPCATCFLAGQSNILRLGLRRPALSREKRPSKTQGDLLRTRSLQAAVDAAPRRARVLGPISGSGPALATTGPVMSDRQLALLTKECRSDSSAARVARTVIHLRPRRCSTALRGALTSCAGAKTPDSLVFVAARPLNRRRQKE